MARNRRAKLPEPVECTIEGMTHDGRGVARIEGKSLFVERALPGERVVARYLRRHRSYDEGVIEQLLLPAAERVEPRCAHFAICGGCALQHLDHAAQLAHKQQLLFDQLRHLGGVEPEQRLPPITGPAWGYRRKARLGVKYVLKKGRLLVGFRERGSPYLADLQRCEVLDPRVGEQLATIAAAIAQLAAFDRIAQIEVAIDDTTVALVVRHLDPLTAADRALLCQFAEQSGYAILLQPGGPDSITPLVPTSIDLHYAIEGIDLHFGPTDFTQVNVEINRALVAQALTLLAPEPHHRVLDLFCGLGNFTLPLARRVAEVVGIEGDGELVRRARENATYNQIDNARFEVADLMADNLRAAAWWQQGFDRALLDPPRSGAEATLAPIARLQIPRLLYVSCNPATLARDAGILVQQHGYRLVSAGIADMFPHTAHVESLALFIHQSAPQA